MVKLIDILREDEEQKPKKILVPRRIEQRQEKRIQIEYQKIQQYIKNGCKGDLNLDQGTITKLPDNLTKVRGDLWLGYSKIKDLNNLKYVEGLLDLEKSPISSLGNLKYVGSDLYLEDTQIFSLGKLEHVGGNLWLENTPLSRKYTEEQIRGMVEVEKKIWYNNG